MKSLNLHLACGSVYLKEGWMNIDVKGELAKDNPELVKENSTDIEHYFKKPYVKKLFGHNKRGKIVVDMLANILELPFDDRSVSKILTVNLIDHLKYQNLPEALTEWRRVLKSGGTLIIDVGDMRGNARKLVEARTREEIEWALRLIYCHSRDRYDSHHWGYDADYLGEILEENSFEIIDKQTDYIKHVYPAFQIFARKK